MKKNSTFYAQQTAQSRIKAEMITKYFASRAKIISGAGATKMVYVDLYAGRGRYDDGAESTPLMVLRRAIEDPVVRKSLATIFNDKDHAEALGTEIRALPGIDSLQYAPTVHSSEVGATTPEVFERIKMAPSLAFLDPWGYKGLTCDLIRSLLKDWGSEVMFFFNFNRVNMDISNPTVTKHMEALFGAPRLAAVRAAVAGRSGRARESVVMAAVAEMVREIGGQFVLPFRFVKDGPERTSHYLVFVTKHFLGYKIMRDVMAKASSYSIDGVPSFEYNTKPPLFMPDGRSIEALAESLTTDLAGRTMTVRQVFEQHSQDWLYVTRNYKDALMSLEKAGRVGVSRPSDMRPAGTLADDITVTFPRLPATGVKAPASRSTLDRRVADLLPSVSARPTA